MNKFRKDCLLRKLTNRLTILLIGFLPYISNANTLEDSLSNHVKQLFKQREYNKISDFLNMDYDLSVEKKVDVSKTLVQNSRSKIDLLYATLYLGISYYQVGEIDRALTTMNKALQFELYMDQPELFSDLNIFTGKIYTQQRNYILAEKKIQLSIVLASQAKVESKIIRGKVELGVILFSQNRCEEATPYFLEAKAFFEAQNNIDNKLIVDSYIASCHLFAQEFEPALKLFKEIDSCALTTNNTIVRSAAVSNQSIIYLYTQEYDLSIEKGKEGYNISNVIRDEYNMITMCKVTADAFAESNRHDSAFHYLKLADSLSSKVYNDEYLKKVEDMETNYEIQQGQQQLAILEKDKLIEEEHHRSDNILYFSLIIGISFLAITILIWVQKQKAVTEKKLQIQKITNEHKEQQLNDANLELAQFKDLINKKDALISRFLNDLTIAQGNITEAEHSEMEKMLMLTKQDIKRFNALFDRAYPGFISHITNSEHDNLTENDLVIIMLIFLDIKSQNQAKMLGISIDSLRKARYRLKKKVLPKDSEHANLKEYINIIYNNYFQSITNKETFLNNK